MAEPSLVEVFQKMVQHMRERAAEPACFDAGSYVFVAGFDDPRLQLWPTFWSGTVNEHVIDNAPSWERHFTRRPMVRLSVENSWAEYLRLLEGLPEPLHKGALVEHYVDCECAGAGLLGAEPVAEPEFEGLTMLVKTGYVDADGDLIDARAFNAGFGGLHWQHEREA